MDNTTKTADKCIFAQAAFAAICGIKPRDEATLLATTRFAQSMFDSPWKSRAEENTRAYAERFYSTLSELGKTTGIREKWGHCFDLNYFPHSPEQAHVFISDFMSELAHFPRNYHDFVCQRRHVNRGSIMDFPVTHPISVEFWAVHLSLDGLGTVTVDDQHHTLSRGDIAIMPPGSNCVVARAQQAKSWTYHWLSFRSKLKWLELLDWATELTTPMFMSINDDSQLQALVYQTEQLEQTSYQPNTLSERLCNNMIENFLIRMRLLAEQSNPQEARIDSRIQAAVVHILNHYHEDISVDALAQIAHASPSRLSALFREHFGISVMKWRDHLRMQKAMELIRHTELPISAIASQVGYPDQFYFSRRFKNNFGEPPTHYR